MERCFISLMFLTQAYRMIKLLCWQCITIQLVANKINTVLLSHSNKHSPSPIFFYKQSTTIKNFFIMHFPF